MTTPHEELFNLKEELSEAKEDCEWAEYRLEHKIFGRKKLWAEHDRLHAEYKKLRKQYMAKLLMVLHQNHGVNPKNVVKSDGLSKKKHSLECLVGKHVVVINAVSIGNRIVFLIEDEALDENEKVEDLIAKRKSLQEDGEQ